MHTQSHALTRTRECLASAQLLLNACVLLVAIKTMNKVASHINEMQKIHEEFGAVFDQLIAEQTGEKKEVRSVSSFPSHRDTMLPFYEV